MDRQTKSELIDSLLREVLTEITDDPKNFIADTFDIEKAIMGEPKFRSIAGKIVKNILKKRQEDGIDKSEFTDKLYNELQNGKNLIWTDTIGVVTEDAYNEKLRELEAFEKKIERDMKRNLYDSIYLNLSFPSDIVDGNVFAEYLRIKTIKNSDGSENDIEVQINISNLLLLPKVIKDLEFYETEDIYDYIRVDIIDSIRDFFVCALNDSILLRDDAKKEYSKIITDDKGTDLIGIKGIINKMSGGLSYYGKLLISEDDFMN